MRSRASNSLCVERIALTVESPNSGPSLEALLGFVAIDKVQHGDHVLTQLCLHALVLFPSEHISSASQLASILDTYFGLTVSSSRIEQALDKLTSQNHISKLPSSNEYAPTAAAKTRVEARINSAHE